MNVSVCTVILIDVNTYPLQYNHKLNNADKYKMCQHLLVTN